MSAYDYEQIAIQWAGAEHKDAVRHIAEHLHANESLHMHDVTEGREPCSYCWLRAAKSIQALQRTGFVVAKPEPKDAPATAEGDAR
jgi:hypothetical protein